jgi:thioredoxin
MRKIFFLAVLVVVSLLMSGAGEKKELEHLNLDSFKEKILDYETQKEWSYKGELPAIIDFYADWCGPCKTIAPIMVELAEEYDGKLMIYKVDTDVQQQLAGMFGIESIPSILFIPMEGQPQMTKGAMAKSEYVKLINEVLKVD